MNYYENFNSWDYTDGVGNYITLVSQINKINDEKIQDVVDKSLDETQLSTEGQELKLSINGKEVSTVKIEDKYLQNVTFDEATKELVFKVGDSSDELRIDLTAALNQYATVADLSTKQDKLTVGKGIQISDENVISVDLDTEIFKVVDVLPTENIENKIYLIPATNAKDNDKFSEHIYVNGEWETVGIVNADTNLENYFTKTECDERFQPKGNYLTEHQDISTLATKDEVNQVKELIPSVEGLATETFVEDKVKDDVKYLGFGENRKTIQLENYNNLSGIDTKGNGHNLAMVSKWDVADFGAVGLHFNINTSDNVTINDNKGENGSIVATSKDIEVLTKENETLKVENTKLQRMMETILNNSYSDTDGKITEETAAVIESVRIPMDKQIVVQSPTVTIKNSFVSGCTTQTIPVIVNNASDVTVDNISSVNKVNKNILEVGLNSSATILPNNVTIKNCNFGPVGNNALNVFSVQDNAVITIENCTFEEVSNVFRFSNRTVAKNVTINFINCIVKKWDVDLAQGLICFQDYTTRSADAFNVKQFGPDKITVNITNLTMPNGEVLKPISDKSEILPKLGEDGQVDLTHPFIAYVYYDKANSDGSGAFVTYDANNDAYPNFNIK